MLTLILDIDTLYHAWIRMGSGFYPDEIVSFTGQALNITLEGRRGLEKAHTGLKGLGWLRRRVKETARYVDMWGQICGDRHNLLNILSYMAEIAASSSTSSESSQ